MSSFKFCYNLRIFAASCVSFFSSFFSFYVISLRRLNTSSNTISALRESPSQFENRIMPRVYIRSITRSTMYQKAPSGVSVACVFSSIKIDYSDYPKSSISRINEVYVVVVVFHKISL